MCRNWFRLASLETGALLDFIKQSLKELLVVDTGAAVILGGDFNKLSVEEVLICTGFVPLVKIPTRRVIFMTSMPGQYNIKLTSTVRSDY